MKCKNCKELESKIRVYGQTNESQANYIHNLQTKIDAHDFYSCSQYKESIKLQAGLIAHLMKWIEKLEKEK